MDNYYDHIGEFINNKLSVSDHEQFQKAMMDDADLSASVENYDIIELVAEELIEQDIQESIDEVKRSSPSRKIRSAKRPWMSIAASSILLIGLGYILLQSSNFPEDLIAAFMPLNNRTSSERGNNDLEAIADTSICERAYDLQQNANTRNESIVKYQEALIFGDKTCKAEAEWNLVLLYLLNRDFDAMQPLLQKLLTKESHPYHERATELNANWKFRLTKLFNSQ